MDRLIQMLVVSRDDALPGEVEDALSKVRGVRGGLHHEIDTASAIAWARDHRPDFVVIGFELGTDDLRDLASAIASASPRSRIVAAYRDNEIDDVAAVIPVVRASVRDFLRRPVSSLELDEILNRLLRGDETTPVFGRVLSFVGNKGGVGKSTLALNAACLLARKHPDRVLLIDASVQLGVCSSMLDLAPQATLADAARQVERLDDALLRTLSARHTSGLRLLAAPQDALDATDVTPRAMSRILTVARRSFDLVVVDTFPMLDALAIALLELSDTVAVVLNGQVPNVLGVETFLKVLDEVGIPPERVRLVMNRTHPRFIGELRPLDIAGRLDRTIDHVVPYSRSVLSAMNTGEPVVLGLRRLGAFGRAVDALAEDLAEGHVAATSTAGRTVELPDTSTGDADEGLLDAVVGARAEETDAVTSGREEVPR